MKAKKPGAFRRGRRAYEATEPRAYDRRFYAGVLGVTFLAILIAIGFALYFTVFYTEKAPEQSKFDLASLAVGGTQQPDPANPCIVLQEHLEATRLGSYRRAYDFLCQGLKKQVSFDAFVANANESKELFRDISTYRCESFKVNGTAAGATAYIVYKSGGHSNVEAAFAREGNAWRISVITVIYK